MAVAWAVAKCWFFESGGDAFASALLHLARPRVGRSAQLILHPDGQPHFYDCTTAAYTYAGEGGADEGDGGGADAPFTGPWPGA